MKRVLVENEYGIFELPAGDHQTKSFEQAGVYEKGYVDMLLRFLEPDDVAIDIGACLGAHTIPYAKVCRHVYAFEPNQQALPWLRKNIELNGFESKITVHDYGLGDRTGNYRLKESLATTGNIGGTQFDL
ncbi:MAG: FkbM family methyltransferase, partial [Candidatus Brocadiales bacterium]|nr:FkbM family methyltransferase [Candidatus Bathyanammoxibius sp.]